MRQKDGKQEIQLEISIEIIGSGGEIRTPDMVINSHPLCQLSYAGTDIYKCLVEAE